MGGEWMVLESIVEILSFILLPTSKTIYLTAKRKKSINLDQFHMKNFHNN